MKIINKGAFYWGMGLTFTLIFIYVFGSSSDYSSTWGKDINAYSFFGKSLYLIPGVLLIIYGLFPDTVLGKGGELIYRLWEWVYRENKS
jgi:hypothetical protein